MPNGTNPSQVRTVVEFLSHYSPSLPSHTLLLQGKVLSVGESGRWEPLVVIDLGLKTCTRAVCIPRYVDTDALSVFKVGDQVSFEGRLLASNVMTVTFGVSKILEEPSLAESKESSPHSTTSSFDFKEPQQECPYVPLKAGNLQSSNFFGFPKYIITSLEDGPAFEPFQTRLDLGKSDIKYIKNFLELEGTTVSERDILFLTSNSFKSLEFESSITPRR